MAQRPLPTAEEVRSYIRDRRNWGRWGKDDQVGAINLITPAKRAAAARLVQERPQRLAEPAVPQGAGAQQRLPAHHYMKTLPRGKGGFAADYYGIFYHGVASTHIDALCHTWDEEAMWNGRDPKKEITFDGATFGSVEHWAEGIITRGVMLDVPRHRGVAVRHPGRARARLGARRHPDQARDHARARRRRLRLLRAARRGRRRIPTGRTASRSAGLAQTRPGLHVSCLPFLRDHDVSLLVWDMLDHLPIGYDIPWAVHAASSPTAWRSLDNALLEPLAQRVRRGGPRRVHADDRAARRSSAAPARRPTPSRCSDATGPALPRGRSS